MKKSRVQKLPDGRAAVSPRKKTDEPITVDIDLCEVRGMVLNMGDPACDPDAAVEKVRHMFESGEIRRLNAEKTAEYARIAAEETNGDAFEFIEMEFLAFRQIMDEDVRDFLPDVHENVLLAALTFETRLSIPISDSVRETHVVSACIGLPTKIEHKRNDAMLAIKEAVIAAASRAKRIGSESYGLWRDALEIVVRDEVGPCGDMDAAVVRRLVSKISAANMMLHLDACIAGYVPAAAEGDEEGEEAGNGI